ncbi:MAG: hypothetical protein OH338_04535 [Candidatus Parvarchaeota archaeon]|nr:hypothetical protein [Candidatus Parvarchaeum tengchongense]MDZ7355957.1 hypothetical protein [candidate division KSB1 bacterium]
MYLLRKNDLKCHDVYEFCSAKNYPNHWNEDSFFVEMEDFLLISPYLDKVFPQYHYYGPQKITLSEWETIKKIAITEMSPKELIDFFKEIDIWLKETNINCNYFWILGI